MPDEIRIPVNAKIPKSLHDSLVAAVEADRYKDKTTCIIEALEIILHNTQGATCINNDVLQGKETEIQNLESVLREKYAEIQRLHSVIQAAPDPLELAEMKGNYTGMQRLLEEKDKRIDDLTREVETLNAFAHYFKNIEVKQIEAPGTKKPWWKLW